MFDQPWASRFPSGASKGILVESPGLVWSIISTPECYSLYLDVHASLTGFNTQTLVSKKNVYHI